MPTANRFESLADSPKESPLATDPSMTATGASARFDGTFNPCEHGCDEALHTEADGRWLCEHLEIARGGLLALAQRNPYVTPDDGTRVRCGHDGWYDLECEALAAGLGQANAFVTQALAYMAAHAEDEPAAPELVVPFTASPAEAARMRYEAMGFKCNANGTPQCCGYQSHEGVKGAIAPAMNGYAPNCEAHLAGRPCTDRSGLRFAHTDEEVWPVAEPAPARPTTPNWGTVRYGGGGGGAPAPAPVSRPASASTVRLPEAQACTNPLCIGCRRNLGHTHAECRRPGGGAPGALPLCSNRICLERGIAQAQAGQRPVACTHSFAECGAPGGGRPSSGKRRGN